MSRPRWKWVKPQKQCRELLEGFLRCERPTGHPGHHRTTEDLEWDIKWTIIAKRRSDRGGKP